MSKAFRIFTVGLAAAAMTSLVGCSQGSESTPSAPSDKTSQATTEEGVESDAATDGKASSRVVENVTLPAPGADPLAMVFQTRQSKGQIDSEQIRVNFPTPEKAVVVTTATGLQDDSVSAIRTRYEFKPAANSTPEQPLWEVVKVTEQNKCQPGRGAENWTGDLCS